MLRPALSLALFAALFAFPATFAADHHEGDERPGADAEGFVELFDGKTLDGWERRNGEATYKVETVDGAPAIVGRTAAGSPNSFLCTEESYGDFILEFEVKLPTRDLNSGVQIRSSGKGEDGNGRVFGPQVEIESSPGDAGYIYGEQFGGWLDPVDEHPVQDAFKNGEWNRFRVEARGENVKTFVNGTPVSDLKSEKVDRDGFVGLQVHGYKGPHPGTVMWRNLRIKPL